jgi:four helix bundle protein
MKSEVKQRAYFFSVEIIKYIEAETRNRTISYAMTDQLIRAATSIGANVVEAKSSSSKKEFIRYYEISLKSANETKYWLCLFRDALKCDKEKTAALLKEADEISKMLASSLLTMKGKK